MSIGGFSSRLTSVARVSFLVGTNFAPLVLLNVSDLILDDHFSGY